MVTFEVHGPFEIPHMWKAGGHVLMFDEFWDDDSVAWLADKRGCYVFAIRPSGGGLLPTYVGKACKTTFKNEAFAPDKKVKYHKGISEYAKCTPLMFFVIRSSRKGKAGGILIKEIEDFLIQAGVAKNPDNMQNVVGTHQPNWRIKGVIRSGVGKKSQTALMFRELFDIHN